MRVAQPKITGTQGTVESHSPVKSENPKTLESQEVTKADYTKASLGQEAGMGSLICASGPCAFTDKTSLAGL